MVTGGVGRLISPARGIVNARGPAVQAAEAAQRRVGEVSAAGHAQDEEAVQRCEHCGGLVLAEPGRRLQLLDQPGAPGRREAGDGGAVGLLAGCGEPEHLDVEPQSGCCRGHAQRCPAGVEQADGRLLAGKGSCEETPQARGDVLEDGGDEVVPGREVLDDRAVRNALAANFTGMFALASELALMAPGVPEVPTAAAVTAQA